ncbi:ESF1 homolog [Ooceraea biroi]|uniref:ESF1-like protein n=1 Tax=Ooceraea biroi TaxID=2015173 RepID=A0A026WYT6_OOCBI|nr:ESF1 homolog [Ooceraea biroi]EZA60993.1 ESF1-like protein [Ooceraea biroi]
MDKVLKDPRFTHVWTDPKFRRIPEAKRKIKIDHRFKDMFEDKKFTAKRTVDKRGRPLNQTTTENLRKYYDLSNSEDEDASVPSTSQKDKKKKKKSKGETKKQANDKQEAVKEAESDSASSEDASVPSTSQKDKKKKSKGETEEQANDNQETVKEAESDSVSDLSDEKDKDESEDDTLLDGNEDLQEEISQLDLEQNKKQLHKKKKNEGEELTSKVKERLRDLSVDYARGQGILLTESSSEDDSSDEASDTNKEEIEHNWGELDKEAETTDEITRRLAICNMDWDKIRAVDLMILLNSFLSSSGRIHSIMIYPSEFGQQRMKEEEINGPVELRNKDIDEEDEINIENDNEESAKRHMEKLRQYQLNRLKYYYAVAEFDSAETANKVYTECDGIEYESTATRVDLRFIPDDMTFDQEPKDTCTEIPEPTKYQPRQFTTTALQQAKVALTWDETNMERREFFQKLNSGKWQDISESDLRTYIASPSEDDSDTNNDTVEKYKSLLKSIEEGEKEEEAKKNKDVVLKVTWGLDSKEKSEKLVEESTKNKEKLTPFEQYLEKRKAKRQAKREERKKFKDENQRGDSEDSVPSDVDMNDKYFAEEFENGKSSAHKKEKKNVLHERDSSSEREENQRKAELELLLMDEKEDGKKHFNMKQIEEAATMSKSKRKRLNKKRDAQEKIQEEDDFEVNVKDPRFAALFTSPDFNIDPTDPHYRKTKGTEAIINEKLKRRTDNETHAEDDKQCKKPRTGGALSTELQVLVKSVKKKAQNIRQPIKN